ncbi:MAG: transposase [Desulfobulbaceae bacterium]|nr:transposase [Desulfobulbaceae bacterium]
MVICTFLFKSLANPRFVVSSLTGEVQKLHDDLYCARGDMENRIKEPQLGLLADRTSCHAWYANQFRLLPSSLADIPIEGIRSLALQGTEFARAQSSTIRLKLFKIGAVITRNTRCIRFLMLSNYPYQLLFNKVSRRLYTI